MIGFETLTSGGQEIRLAETKETAADGSYAYCRQYVQSVSREVTPGAVSRISMQDLNRVLPADKTTIVLGNQCQWTKG